MELRPYQAECLDIIDHLDPGAYLVQMATGLGKTFVFSHIKRKGRVLVLAHREELVHQPAPYYDCPVGFEMASEHSHGEEVVIASVQSLFRRLNQFQPDDFDMIITDECFPAGTFVDGRRIEDIKVGDYVTAYNHETERMEQRMVTHVFKREAPDHMVRLNRAVCCTPNHPFFEGSRGEYVAAEDLRLGDVLMVRHEDRLVPVDLDVVEHFKISTYSEPGSRDGYVYNLEVEGLNNYFANNILVHNCHHAVAKSYRAIYDYFNPRLHIGFTATANRGDKVRLDSVYQDIVFQRDLKWGIDHKYLSNIYCIRVDIGYDLRKVKKRMGDYEQKMLDLQINQAKINVGVAEAYKKYAVGQTLIFATSVQHAHNIADLIDGAVVVSAATENRAEILEKFKNRKIPCIVNCMIFTEGTDLPLVETIIIARPTQNQSLYSQMVGRGTRLYEDKKYLTLIDCVGVTEHNELCTAPTLLGIDADEVPEDKRDKLNGLLTDMPEIVEELAAPDVPVQDIWVLSAQEVQLFAEKEGLDMRGVKWVRNCDGSMHCSLGNNDLIELSSMDQLGRSTLVYQKRGFDNELVLKRNAPLQECLDYARRFLMDTKSNERGLWDMECIARWGCDPATDKQKNYIRALLQKPWVKKSQYAVQPNFLTLTKQQAANIIDLLVKMKPA